MKYYIKELREAAGMSQEQLAEELTRTTGKMWKQNRVSNYEKGKRKLTFEIAEEFAGALKCSPPNLFYGPSGVSSSGEARSAIDDAAGKLFSELAIMAAELKGYDRPDKAKELEIIKKIWDFYSPEIEKGQPPTAEQVVRLATTLLDKKTSN